jgi:HK97 gp10 family phage protein
VTETEIKVKGLAELAKFFEDMPQKMVRNIVSGALRAGAKPIRDDARSRIHSVSGKLAKGIKIKTKTQGTKVTARVVVTGDHAFIGHMLEFTGAAPHLITAYRGELGALKIGSQFVFKVQHPGFQPKPFLRPALDTKAAEATVAAGNYIKYRLATKNGLDTSDVSVEVER